MRGGTLFSGIGAPECAMPWANWRWAAEIDPFASAVHACRFPGVVNLGDVTIIDSGAVEPVDLAVFGSPCQSFSVAGKRLGLDDPRGNLALIALRLIGRIRPRWLVFENVPGLLSSDGGRDFGAFLGLLGQCGYGFAYRVLDAQYAGVPQRRRRIFVVGYLGDWRPPAAVLFESESLRGDTPPRREAGQRIARPVASSPEGGSGYRNDADTAENLIAFDARQSDICVYGTRSAPLDSNGFSQAIAFGGNRQSGPVDVATAVNAHGGPHGRLDFESETFVLRSDASREGVAKTPSLDAEGRLCLRDPGFSVMTDSVPTIDGGAAHIVAHSLRADGFDASEDGTGRGTPLVPVQCNGSNVGFDLPSLRAGNQHITGGGPAVAQAMSVRRLTPRECERLQGFPDDWTAIQYRGKPAADGPRYRAIGNSMAVPVVGWVGHRIQLFEEAMASLAKGSAAA